MVKSYYAKTALLWLCEQTPKDDWTTVSQSVIKLLDFLDDAVDTGKLPCYFWSEVNLLRFTSQGDREVMKKALHDIRQNLNSHLAREFCVYKPGLQEMLTQTTTKLTERQAVEELAVDSGPVEGQAVAKAPHKQVCTRMIFEELFERLISRRKMNQSGVFS
ncbi:hypothetical protein FJT64_027282 [Amphibalanus amphitrite]|uniref:Mab-21-like HhH/H2TH-like domain-containing protein n=1 Tax=Amphibalanus amphitrite TaxID=1232801 RepID=A0A6A4VZ05_AMPAM|nr:hypothetical protein FJT64_027282 [Amphibalanus amphitrite]